MVRLRREKGGATRPSQTQPGAVSKNDLKGKEVKGKRKEKDKGKGSISISKDAILALGGEEADMDLLKGVDESAVAVSGQENHDPMLSKDVSKFLKGLNLKDSHPQPQPKKNNGKGKEKVKALSEQPSTKEKSTSISEPDKSTKPSKKTQKERSKTKAKTSSATNAASVPAPPDQPKTTVKLPAKVPINPKSHFVFTPTSQWYAALPALPPQAPPPPLPTPAQFASLSSKAAQLHAADTDTFLTSSAASSASAEASFMAKIIQSGTLSDRLSALTLLVQSSPVHNTKALEGLRGLGERGKGKGGREESLKALRCVVDWWVGGGVPGRKLRYFRDQPLLHPGVTDEYLVVWYFEDWLKKYFFSILQILETLSLDPLPYVRTQSLTLISTLLRDSPEQEHNLLRLLVNKLGDTDKALCARASWHLLQLLQRHPEMKGVVVREVVGMVMRPGAGMSAPAEASAASTAGAAGGKHIRFSEAEKLKTKPQTKPKEKRPSNAHARYYAAVTFNQIVLSPGDRDVALRLLDVYFEMFKEVLGEGSESDVQEEGAPAAAEEVKTDKNGRVLDESKAKGKGRKGEKGGGEKKGAAGFTEVEDENSRLVSAILTGVNRALPFAKVDTEDAGINKHIDTLFLITHKSTFNISLQALMLIQQITASLLSSSSPSSSTTATTTTANSIIDRYYRTLYASLYDTRLATSSKQAMYLNLFFKSVKADVGHTGGNERVRALVRRFVQVLVSGGGGATEFVAGGLYLLGELFSTIPGLRQMVTRPLTEMKEGGEEYDPRKREPQFAHAGSSPLWELTSLLNHYHPAISLHARQLLSSQSLTASADLSQNTLSQFLDRFVYKNPKKLKASKNAAEGDDANVSTIPGAKGASVMQPAASALEGVKLVKGEMPGGGGLGVNEKAFVRRKRGEVPVDQLFFHDYFTRKQEREKAMTKKRKDGAEDEEEEEEENGEEQEVEEGEEDGDVGDHEGEAVKLAGSDWDEEADSDLEEEEIWKAMKASMPTAGDDDLMDDSDSENSEDEDEVPDFGDDSDLAIEDDLEDDDQVEDEDAEEKEDSDDDLMSLIEGSDNEDLISLDGDVPEGLIEYDGSDDSDDGNADPGVLLPDADADVDVDPEEEEWHGIGVGTSKNDKKRKHDEATAGGKGGKRKKLRSLPTFASYEDYAKLIEGPEDDI